MLCMSKFRSDIAGLRGVAITAVVLYHINEEWLPGGFVGVDVFFVVSGFLVTASIVRAVESGNFGFLEFYAHRIRRLFPAVTCVLVLNVVATALLFRSADFSEVLWSTGPAVLSLANFFFAFAFPSGYFAPSMRTKPLLHLWSLSVEEQFYLVWPFVLHHLVAVKRKSRLETALVVLLLSISSFLLGQVMLWQDYEQFAYFMLPCRVGELGLGAIVFLVMSSPMRPVPSFLIGLLGLVLTIGPMFYLDNNSAFPGLHAVVPTLGAALLLSCSSPERLSVAGHILSLAPLQLLGEISYSLYLVHWPLVAYASYHAVLEDGRNLISAFVYSLMGATLLYLFVEKPLRFVKWSLSSIYIFLLLLPMIFALLLVSFLLLTGAPSLAGYVTTVSSSPSQTINHQFAPNVFSFAGDASAFKSVPACQKIVQDWFLNVDEANLPHRSGFCEFGPSAEAWLWPKLRAVVSAAEISDLMTSHCQQGVGGGGGERRPSRALVIGDSLAVPTVAFLSHFAKVLDVPFDNLSWPSCLPAIPYSTDGCRAFYDWAIEHLVPLYETVIVVGKWTRRRHGTEPIGPAVASFVQSLQSRRGVKVLVVGQPPRMQTCGPRIMPPKRSALDLACLGKYPPDLRASETTRINAQLALALHSLPRCQFWDYSHFKCPAGACSHYLLDTFRISRDDHHMDIGGALLLGCYVAENYGVPAVIQAALLGD